MTVTVLAHGCWDGLHIGHIRHLQQAKGLGDRLVVGVTADEYVAKGPNRPRYPLAARIEALKALRFVDEVIAVHASDPCGLITAARPAYYVKGFEYAGKEIPELATCAFVGARVEFVGETLGSSSAAINAEVPTHPFLAACREEYTAKDVDAAFDAMREVETTVIGDVIIDEYVEAEIQGLTSKGGAPSLRVNGREEFQGGVGAIRAHIRALRGEPKAWPSAIYEAKKTRFYSMAGGQMRTLAAVEQFFPYNVSPTQRGIPELKGLVLVGDYGHGAINDDILAVLNEYGRCAVTCQTNSANYGLNVLTKRYSHVGLFVVDDRELKLACHTAEPTAADLAAVRHRLGAFCRGYWTRGERSTWDHAGNECPALEARPLDPLGAGDAFFVVAALCWAAKVPEDLSLLLAQIAGAQLTRVLGNSQPLDVEAMKRTAAAILA